MEKSINRFSFAFMILASVSLTACTNSPKAAEKAEVTKQVAVEQYKCPMKCEGDKIYTAMGKCPVCGMDLKSIKIESKEENHEGHKH